MATIDELGSPVAEGARALFKEDNFCFSTWTPHRSPTFYFAVGGVNRLNTAQYCGRLRTEHSEGPLIDISTHPKGHVFFGRKSVQRELARNIRHTGSRRRRRTRMDTAERSAWTFPVHGFYHYEYTKGFATIHNSLRETVLRTHPSGGRVALNPRPTQVQIDRLLSVMLATQCTVKLNGAVWKKYSGPNPRPVPGVQHYLDSLGV